MRYQATVRHLDEAERISHENTGFEAGWGAALAYPMSTHAGCSEHLSDCRGGPEQLQVGA